ncbi:hypothetical protein DFJ73DRAFT_808029 [Zopfochytrium polystomum]|nr:hypothetical protein DFJ73DRAFT_808029 [Zopfochytrium polystomum]
MAASRVAAGAGRVIVTYWDEYEIWPQIAEDVSARFPLRNLIWSNTRAQQGNRIIESLDVEMRLFRPDMFPRAMIGASTPFFVHLCLINCEDHEMYRSTVKRQIQEWLNVVGNKKNQEWFIVYATPNDPRKAQNRGFLGGGTVFDKIKSDFSPKMERLVYVRLHSSKDPEAWAEFFQRLKESILSSFSRQVAQYEEDTRRLDSQRLKPGWNYCQYFILKDGFAATFEMMNMHDEALLQYDELEAAFFQNLREQGAPWFQTFGGTASGDDSNDILDMSLKPYRDMILQNTITIFDFQIYLFARQVQILFRLVNGPHEICHRAKQFISSFARTIQDYKVSLIPYFAESWIYSGCLNVIKHCDELIAVSAHSENLIIAYENAKAELLHYARVQLDILGVASKLFPTTIHSTLTMALPGPNAMAPPGSDESDEALEGSRALSELTNTDIRDGLKSKEAFDELYTRITMRCIKAFDACNRQRTVALLRGDIALLHFQRERYEEAAKIWDDFGAPFSGNNWFSSETSILEKLALCLKKTGRFSRYVTICLRLLSNWGSLSADMIRLYMSEVAASSHKLEEPVAVGQMSILKLAVVKMINRVSDDDTVEVEVEVYNFLSEPIPANSIICTLLGTDEGEIVCATSDVTIPSGKSSVLLRSADMVAPGTYHPGHAAVCIGKVSLSYELPKTGRRRHVFKISRNPSSLTVKVGIPKQVLAGDIMNSFTVTVRTRHTRIESGFLTITPITTLTVDLPKTLQCQFIGTDKEGKAQTNREGTLDVVDGIIQLPTCEANEALIFSAPILVDPLNVHFDHTLKIVAWYNDGSGLGRRVFSSAERLKLAIPMKIQHTILFSPTGPLVQVQCVGLEQRPIRLLQGDLLVPDGVEVVDFTPETDMTLLHRQEAAFLFQLTDTSDKKTEGFTSAKFVLDYCDVNEEIGFYAESKLIEMLEASGLSRFRGFALRVFQDEILDKLNASHFILGGDLEFALPDAVFTTYRESLRESLIAALAFESDEDRNGVLKLFESFLKSFQHMNATQISRSTNALGRQIVFNFEIPFVKILLSAEIATVPEAKSATIGEPIACRLTVRQLFWKSDENEVALRYSVLADANLWMIAGYKRHEFSLKREQEISFDLTLVPVHPGQLLLPDVHIAYSNGSRSSTQRVDSSAEQLLILPAMSGKLFIPLNA